VLRRKLGSQGLDVPAIGLGCMGMTIQYGTLNDEESLATIHHSIDAGLNLLNTADAYGNGKNEILICSAIRRAGQRSSLILSLANDKADGSAGVDGRPDM